MGKPNPSVDYLAKLNARAAAGLPGLGFEVAKRSLPAFRSPLHQARLVPPVDILIFSQTLVQKSGGGHITPDSHSYWYMNWGQASRLRDEFLNQEVFADLQEAKALSAWWHNEYNHRRPHSSLGYRTPAEFAASFAEPPLQLGASPQASATAQQTVQSSPQTLIGTGT